MWNELVSNNWVRSNCQQSKLENITEQNINLMGVTPFKTRNAGITNKENMSDYKGKAHGRNKTMFAETVCQL